MRSVRKIMRKIIVLKRRFFARIIAQRARMISELLLTISERRSNNTDNDREI